MSQKSQRYHACEWIMKVGKSKNLSRISQKAEITSNLRRNRPALWPEYEGRCCGLSWIYDKKRARLSTWWRWLRSWSSRDDDLDFCDIDTDIKHIQKRSDLRYKRSCDQAEISATSKLGLSFGSGGKIRWQSWGRILSYLTSSLAIKAGKQRRNYGIMTWFIGHKLTLQKGLIIMYWSPLRIEK